MELVSRFVEGDHRAKSVDDGRNAVEALHHVAPVGPVFHVQRQLSDVGAGARGIAEKQFDGHEARGKGVGHRLQGAGTNCLAFGELTRCAFLVMVQILPVSDPGTRGHD